MQLSLFEQTYKKKLTRRLTLFLFGLALLYAVVCTPLYLVISSDILMAETILPLLLDIIMTVFNYFFYWIAFAYIAFMILRYGIGASKSAMAIYTGASAFFYVANLICGYFVIGFPLWEDFTYDELPYLIWNIVLNLGLMAATVLIAHFLGERLRNRKQRLTDELPIERLTEFQNGIGLMALLVACVPAAAQMVSRIIYDFSMGAPRGPIDLLWMIVYYCSDALFAVLGYLVTVWIWNQISVREVEVGSEFGNSIL